jgi:hypothetical protein
MFLTVQWARECKTSQTMREKSMREIRHSIRRTLTCATLVILASCGLSSVSFAAQASTTRETDQCQLIPVGIERALCFDREHPELRTEELAAQVKLEDEKLAKRLQGICRGC